MDISDLERMGRRRFMENLAGVGVSATTLQELTQDELSEVTEDPEEKVPYLARYETVEKEPGKAPVREPVYETIPRGEWERRKTAIDAADRIDRQVEEELGDPRISAAFRADPSSPTDFGVAVRVPDDPSLEHSLEVVEQVLPSETAGHTPESDPVAMEGIPVDVELRATEPLACYNLQHYDEVPGGQATGGGTLTGTFYSNARNQDGWATAGHIVDGEGDVVFQDTGSSLDDIGVMRDRYNEDSSDPDGAIVDCGFVEPTSDETFIDYICEEDNSSKYGFPIEGIILNQELQHNVGNQDYGVRMQGKTSCKKTGYIKEMDNGDSIDVSKEMDNGDSGGPAYRVADGKAYIVGIIGDRLINSTGTQCTTAETTEQTLDGSFW
jgi:hypothetical protein